MIFRSLTLSTFVGLLTVPAFAGVFFPEMGNYKFTLHDIETSYQKLGLTYLTVDHSRAIPDARYKINKSRREYQIKKWYQRDWYEMQDMFSLDVNAFNQHYQRGTFNEAKRSVFGDLKFDKVKNRHKKIIPTPREWGGLNHPPLRFLAEPLEVYSSAHAPIDDRSVSSPYFAPDFHESIDEVSKSELSFGNSITLLEDRQAFEAKKDLIRSAKKTILMGSLVFVCDKGTREITELLIESHKAGVDVRVLVDDTIGRTIGHLQCTGMLERAGVQVIGADDFWIYGRAVYHTKSLIVDFETSISGGHNMLDADNLSRGTDFQNRDVDILTRGPMVTDIAMAFLKDWTHFYYKYPRRLTTNVDHYVAQMNERLGFERTIGLRGADFYPQVLGDVNSRMNGVCRYIRQTPAEDRQIIGRAYLKMLDGVQNYLAITNPIMADSRVTKLNRPLLPIIEWKDRFVMYNKLFNKLQTMAKSGLRIDLLTTNIDMSGNENVAMLNEDIREYTEQGRELQATWALAQIGAWNFYYGRPHYKNLLNDWVIHPNVHVWTHISFLHSKVFHFDRIAASVGSYNLQHNATDHSYEGTAICQDSSLNQQLDRVLVQDMANSIPLIFKK